MTFLPFVTFLNPERLLGLLVLVGLAIAYVMVQFRSREYAVRFTNLDLLDSIAPARPGWRRHLPAIAFLLAGIALVAAFARPARSVLVPRERATVILAIDTSLSMDAQDVDPSRIGAAKAAASSFLDLVPPSVNVGLVSFNGIATVRVAPTHDHAQVARAINQLELGESTAIGEAIFASLGAIATVPPDAEGTPPPARIVLMSDGETTVGRDDRLAAAAALEATVPVSTIAFGTEDGEIVIPQEPFPVPVPVNPAALSSIADATNGSFFEAPTAERLSEVYADIGSSIGFEEDFAEISSWFVGAGLLLLALAALFSLFWFSRLP